MTKQPLFEQLLADPTLDAAYEWHAETASNLRDWADMKDELRARLANDGYAFHPLHRVHTEDGPVDQWDETDRIVINAMTLVFEGALAKHLSPSVCHRRGGAEQAVEVAQDYLTANPDCWVMKADVAGLYANIDHAILHQQLAELIPEERFLLRLVWQYLAHSVEDGGTYQDIEQGIAGGCSLSPLLAALYLRPLDQVLTTQGTRYARFMDYWVAFFPTQWGLRKGVKAANHVLEGLQLAPNPDKIFIGRGPCGFDFLGYRITPGNLAVSKAARSVQAASRDSKVARRLEPGADQARIERYLSRLQTWLQGSLEAPMEIPRGVAWESVYKRLGQFGLAAGSLGSGGFAAAEYIQVTGTGVSFMLGDAALLVDLDGGGAADFALVSRFRRLPIVVVAGLFNSPDYLGLGSTAATPGPSSDFSAATLVGDFTSLAGGTSTHWYIPFAFGANGGSAAGRPGWLSFNYDGASTWTLTNGYYNDAGDTIRLGATEDPFASAVPAPTTLALLMGGSGLLAGLRRRRASC